MENGISYSFSVIAGSEVQKTSKKISILKMAGLPSIISLIPSFLISKNDFFASSMEYVKSNMIDEGTISSKLNLCEKLIPKRNLEPEK
jgi:hypothetical protein